MRQIPLIDLKTQYSSIQIEIDNAIKNVLLSGKYILGENVRSFEESLAKYCNTKFAIGVGSGTDALVMSLIALGVGQKDEVITSPFTFSATINSILRVGATPVFVDIEEDSFNIDCMQIEDKITRKTKAIMPVHIFGQPANMDAIVDIAKQKHLVVIEDAAQAIGSKYNNRMIGGIGQIGATSFYPSKSLGAYGDGGAILVNDEEIKNFICAYRTQGAMQKGKGDYVGLNSRLDELQAAVLKVKLQYLDQWIYLKRKIAKVYYEQFRDSPILPAVEIAGAYHSYSLYSIIVPERRDLFVQYMRDNGISVNVYYPNTIYSQPVYQYLRHEHERFPVSEYVCDHIVSLPCFPELEHELQHYICDKAKSFYS